MVEIKIDKNPRVLTPEEQDVADAEKHDYYKHARKHAMPEIGDVIDAICKFIDTGDRAEFDTIQAQRQEVKTRFQKV